MNNKIIKIFWICFEIYLFILGVVFSILVKEVTNFTNLVVLLTVEIGYFIYLDIRQNNDTNT